MEFAGPPPSPHVFTSGAFLLIIPSGMVNRCCEPLKAEGLDSATSSANWTLRTEALQEIVHDLKPFVGTALFAIIRRGAAAGVSLSSTTWPQVPLCENDFAAVFPAPAATAPAASVHDATFVFRPKDSRLSAGVQEAVSRAANGTVALTTGRLQRMPSANAGEDAVVAAKRRMNFDEDLFDDVQRAVESVPFLRTLMPGAQDASTGAPRPAQQPAHALASFLAQDDVRAARFLENVTFAGVLMGRSEEETRASPFACFIYALHLLRVSRAELAAFAKHENRYLRAAILYFARLTMAPEDLAPFFGPSMDDRTIIACSADNATIRSLSEIANALLDNDELDEAFFPPYSKWWRTMALEPMKREMLHPSSTGAAAGGGVAARSSAANSSVVGEREGATRKRARGALCGFRSAMELLVSVEQARVLERGKQVEAFIAEAFEAEDPDAADEELLARRKQTSKSNENHGADATSHFSKFEAAQGSVPQPAIRQDAKGGERERRQVANVKKWAATSAHRAIVELLGPFSKSAVKDDDPIFLRF